MEPTSLRFWGIMSLATMVGAVVAYPINVWLVQAGYKHGMGTERPPAGASDHGALTRAEEAVRSSRGLRAHGEGQSTHFGH
jgi:hypothetical protein